MAELVVPGVKATAQMSDRPHLVLIVNLAILALTALAVLYVNIRNDDVRGEPLFQWHGFGLLLVTTGVVAFAWQVRRLPFWATLIVLCLAVVAYMIGTAQLD